MSAADARGAACALQLLLLGRVRMEPGAAGGGGAAARRLLLDCSRGAFLPPSASLPLSACLLLSAPCQQKRFSGLRHSAHSKKYCSGNLPGVVLGHGEHSSPRLQPPCHTALSLRTAAAASAESVYACRARVCPQAGLQLNSEQKQQTHAARRALLERPSHLTCRPIMPCWVSLFAGGPPAQRRAEAAAAGGAAGAAGAPVAGRRAAAGHPGAAGPAPAAAAAGEQ
jgi:hypothetical protein